ncbi:MAG: hypothetical protein HN826_00060 [Methylococcales bacterium]|jgi:CRISPR type IV-associated protein Csf2|nr:hypothetical protein [Methylococcales bacterium]
MINFDTIFTTISPLVHTSETFPSPGGYTYARNIERNIYAKNPDGKREHSTIPVVQSNTIRNAIRRSLANVIYDALLSNNEKVELNQFFQLSSGGRMSAGKEMTIKERLEIIESKSSLDLMGGGFEGGLLESSLSVGFAWPITDQTLSTSVVPANYENESIGSPTRKQILDEISQNAKDPIKEGFRLDALSENALDDAFSYIDSSHAAAQEKSKARKNKEKTDVKKEAKSHYYKTEAISAGIPMFCGIIIKRDSEIQAGLLLETFKKFASFPVFGGLSSKGCGFVNVEIKVSMSDGKIIKTPIKIVNSKINWSEIEKDKIFSKWLKESAKWLSELKPDQLDVR